MRTIYGEASRRLVIGVFMAALFGVPDMGCGGEQCNGIQPPALNLVTAAYAATGVSDVATIPNNPYLANSPWPVSHANGYAQDSSPLPGISASRASNATEQLVLTAPVPINPVQSGQYPDGSRAVWYADQTGVGKIALANGVFSSVARIPTSAMGVSGNTVLSAAYNLVDSDNIFYVAYGASIIALRDATPNASSASASLIAVAGQFAAPLPSDDTIAGLNMTYDGFLAYTSARGVIGVVSRSFAHGATVAAQHVTLPNAPTVRNSIAVDELGGIYVVTNTTMNRVTWDGSRLSRNAADGAWSSTYEGGAYGSGSTPTLMGLPDAADRLVVITDGLEPMNIVAFWRDTLPTFATGRIAGSKTVSFRNGQSQQSVVVGGYGAVVVNNTVHRLTPTPYGMQKFVWSTTTHSWSSAWINTSISVPNGLPCLSTASGIVYAVAYDATSSNWSLALVDWNTGAMLFIPYASGPDGDSAGSGVSIGDDGAVLSGTVSGVEYWQ